MKKMKFDSKQPDLTIYELEDGKRDVLICLNEQEIKETDEQEQETTTYEYDANSFRTCKLTEDQIKEDLESYLNYEGDEAPTDEMVEYANEKIDEYTAQLMEDGII